jgi:response regulator NasT
MRVVVADDQELVRVVLDHVLREAGHEVVAAVGDGRAAYLRTRELRPDAVVLDLGMPELDGIATLRLLRDSDPDLRIIVHTGFDDDDLTDELFAAGSDAVVVKSADPSELLRAVDAAVRV